MKDFIKDFIFVGFLISVILVMGIAICSESLFLAVLSAFSLFVVQMYAKTIFRPYLRKLYKYGMRILQKIEVNNY